MNNVGLEVLELCDSVEESVKRIRSRISAVNGGVLGRGGMWNDIDLLVGQVEALEATVRQLTEGV
jgi:hypothetical protein